MVILIKRGSNTGKTNKMTESAVTYGKIYEDSKNIEIRYENLLKNIIKEVGFQISEHSTPLIILDLVSLETVSRIISPC